MPRKSSSTPTEGELAILRTLWTGGSLSVREVHNRLNAARPDDDAETGYSTTLKMMQVMFDKGLLVRDESVRPQLYRPAEAEEKTQLQLLDYLIQTGFGGSAMRLVLRAAAAKRISRDDLAEIKKLLEKGKQP